MFMRTILVLTVILLPPELVAETVMFRPGDDASRPKVIAMPDVEYPGSNIRRGQESWVKLSYVIDADGRAVDPIVVDSVGGAPFEQAARDHLVEVRFEPPDGGIPLPLNHFGFVFDVDGGRGKATRSFMRRYALVMKNLENGNVDKAGRIVADAERIGGWNRYEMSMLMLMAGRIAGDRGDPVTQLEYLRRALGGQDQDAVVGRTLPAVLETIFTLELDRGQVGNAEVTLERMKRLQPDSDVTKASEARLAGAMRQAPPATVEARIYNPCNCDEGVPIWVYRPAFREFSFEATDDNVRSFEARCERGRIRDDVSTKRSWRLPDDWGTCEIYVFGEDAANFRLIDGYEGGTKSDEAETSEP